MIIKSLLKLRHSILHDVEVDTIRKLDLLLEKEAIRSLAADKSIVITAAFLTNEGKNDLKNWWESNVRVPLLSNIYMHHLTIKYRPSKEEVLALEIGKEVALAIVGYIENDSVQAVVVASDLPCSNKVPHITVSTADGVGPMKSNKFLNKGFKSTKGPAIAAKIGYLRGGEAVYEYPEEVP
jgi:hypothetical protein